MIKTINSLSRYPVNFSIIFGLVGLLLFFVVSGYVSYQNIQAIDANTQQVMHTHKVILGANRLLSEIKDAETGQRGYVLTGNDSYLAPYNSAVQTI